MESGEEVKLDQYFGQELNANNLTSTADPWANSSTSTATVVGNGLSEETTVKFANNLQNPTSASPDESTQVQTVSSRKLSTNTNNNKAPNTKIKDFLLASSYVNDAVEGRTLRYNTDRESLNLYQTYSNRYLRFVTILAMWFLLAIALFEEPAVPGCDLPFWATMLMEVVCLSVIVFRMKQIWEFVPRHEFTHDTKNIMVCTCVVLTLIDMVIYIGTYASNGKGIRVSRVLRPIFLVNMNESKQVRRAFRNIRNTIKDILNVLILFIFSIAFFTLLAYKLFQHRKLMDRDGQPYFTNYLESFFNLYVLVTTANSPDIMMPAYDSSGWFTLFFIIYIIVNTYIFMNLFLAVIYNSYRANLKAEIKVSVYWKNKQLDLAFSLLRDYNENFPTGYYISYETWSVLMKRISYPPSSGLANLYWEVLKTKTDNHSETSIEGIEKKQFLQLSNLLNVCVREKKPRINDFQKWFPTFYMSKASKFMKKSVNSWYFVRFYDLLIVINAICIGIGLEATEWFFLAMFMVEIFLRVYTVGPREYFLWTKKWNLFDFVIIALAFFATMAETILNNLNDTSEEVFPQEVLDFLMVIRCLRVLRIVASYQSFRIVVMTILNILPSMLTYGAVLLAVYYIFAIVGMESYSGMIKYTGGSDDAEESYCNNIKLKDSEFVRIGYCNNNFNDILHSFVLLVELTVVNQWHIITLGYSLVTTKWTRVYFIFFHVVVVILIMNIIVAFVLEAFILEYSVPKSAMESAVEKTIRKLGLEAKRTTQGFIHDRTVLVKEEDDSSDDDEDDEAAVGNYVERAANMTRTIATGPSHFFKLGHGHKNIETLLQRMFEGELKEEDFEDIDPISITHRLDKTSQEETTA